MKLDKIHFGIYVLIVTLLVTFLLKTTVLRETYDGKAKAYITEDYVCYEYRGRVYRQCIRYVFVVDGKLYQGTKKAEYRQQIGNTLEIAYSPKNPNTNKIVAYHDEYLYHKEEAFLHLKKEGYRSIKLINGLYFFKEYAKEGKLVLEELGTYEERSDTLHLVSLLKDTSRIYIRQKNDQLLDLTTGQLYK